MCGITMYLLDSVYPVGMRLAMVISYGFNSAGLAEVPWLFYFNYFVFK